MNEPAKETKPAAKSGSGAWIVRIVVFGILGALLVVALLEFNAKRNFETSQANLVDMLERPLKEAEEELVGSYDVADGKKEGRFDVKIYTWSGPFRSYTLKVKVAGADQSIESVSGKDDEAEE